MRAHTFSSMVPSLALRCVVTISKSRENAISCSRTYSTDKNTFVAQAFLRMRIGRSSWNTCIVKTVFGSVPRVDMVAEDQPELGSGVVSVVVLVEV